MENQKTTIEKIENGRAVFAFNEIQKYVKEMNKKGEDCSEFRNYIKKMPALIQVNGLGQTLAFYYSKGDAYKKIYHIIGEWLQSKLPSLIEENKELIECVVNLNSQDYKVVTIETLALLNWLTRFADGMISSKKS